MASNLSSEEEKIFRKKCTNVSSGNEVPNMKLMHEVIIPRVSYCWRKLADYMEYPVAKKKEIQERQRDDPYKCCAELMEDWLTSDRGVKPKTWHKLVSVLKEIKELSSSVNSIEQRLLKDGLLLPQVESTVGVPFTSANTSSSASMHQGTNSTVTSSTKDEGLISRDDLKNDVDKILFDDTNDSAIRNTIQILLVTANETEYGAALTFLKPLEGFTKLLKYHHVNSRINKNTLYVFGKFGYFNAAVMLLTNQGPADAQDVVTVAGDCFDKSLNAIFAVGVACGVKGKSNMLDVLVSKTISTYTAARIGTDGDGEYKIENRSTSNMPVSSFLKTYFNQPPKWPGKKSIATKLLLQKPTQVTGNILSGHYLIDNMKAKETLLNAFANDAIGIEMEGAGLIKGLPDTRYKIMIVKAVCDFGDGKKNKKYQPTAAMLAVECLMHCIGNSRYLPEKLAKFCGNEGNDQPDDNQPKHDDDDDQPKPDDSQPKPDDDNQPKPDDNQPKPDDDNQPKPDDDNQPKPDDDNQPKPDGDGQPKPDEPKSDKDDQPGSEDHHKSDGSNSGTLTFDWKCACIFGVLLMMIINILHKYMYSD